MLTMVIPNALSMTDASLLGCYYILVIIITVIGVKIILKTIAHGAVRTSKEFMILGLCLFLIGIGNIGIAWATAGFEKPVEYTVFVLVRNFGLGISLLMCFVEMWRFSDLYRLQDRRIMLNKAEAKTKAIEKTEVTA